MKFEDYDKKLAKILLKRSHKVTSYRNFNNLRKNLNPNTFSSSEEFRQNVLKDLSKIKGKFGDELFDNYFEDFSAYEIVSLLNSKKFNMRKEVIKIIKSNLKNK